ncbi:heme ABC transporter ATP-binding protein [Salinadaptatus halalkaliphilus]|uniref:Cobalamin import ATP-binding protein BtuD n=1 Tax=Salinadaptatus halalkaliphilus TaxID=2419781 RepID=A0A4S3TQF3_9EURY|nr:heme ABC transporter ATP-binding protein [Salinadaptatus halalkaliphilus]THE64778.1 heme ABC transporter ATP-binding protein [Salinadaptatus halalkaliphilus]
MIGTDAPRATDETTDDESTTIDIEDVSLSFGDHDVLEDVSIGVESGEFVGLVGPNGAGKTTLLRAISGALEPDTGRIAINGTDVHEVGSRTSSRLVAVVPQDTSLSFSFPVRDVVAMGRHPHRSRFSTPDQHDREAVDDALERTRTTDLAERPIDEVSGGQRQRVVLARAIAQETPALLLDEPTASLDINHQIETLELVRELLADGQAVVAAIHDLTLAARYCDRLALLADGGVHSVGSPAAVLSTDALSTAFDATATVTTNPVTGTETVTALPNESLETDVLSSVESDSSQSAGQSTRQVSGRPSNPRVHVLGSGTTAAGALARLETATVDPAADDEDDDRECGDDDRGDGNGEDAVSESAALEVSVGPVARGSVAADLADQFATDSVIVNPFTALSSEHRERIDDWLRAADVVVLADADGGSRDGPGAFLERLETADSFVPEHTVVVTDRSSVADRAVGDGGSGWRYDQCREQGYEATVETVFEAVGASLEDRVGSDRLE